jgi:hypothetical protein
MLNDLAVVEVNLLEQQAAALRVGGISSNIHCFIPLWWMRCTGVAKVA